MAELTRADTLQGILDRIHEGEYDTDSRDARYWLEDLIAALRTIEELQAEVVRLQGAVKRAEESYAWARIAADDAR